MDKLLMMSILSSSPAEISGSSWPSLSVSIQNSKKKKAGGGDDANCNNRKISDSSSTAGSDHHQQQQQQMQKQRFLRWLPLTTTAMTTTRCAPELDGLNFFETFVSY